MSAYKRKSRSGKPIWFYMFALPGGTRQIRNRISASGFATKREAEEAEALRRIEEHQKQEMAKAGASVAARPPRTLGLLLEEFFAQHVDGKLAPKTAQRYHEQAAYLDLELLQMPIGEITPLHLGREWNRLLKSGGHYRKTKAPRPLSTKTVRNVSGVVSSAFSRAIRWGLVTANPVFGSEPPVLKKRRGIALAPSQQDIMVAAAGGPWCLGTFLEVCAATGARRGEVLALRWKDIDDGRVVISRSLSQTKQGLTFKVRRPRTAFVP